MKPRLLDLFCGAGGAAMGYYRAGFEVVGVDIEPQKHYPFEFHQADAMRVPFKMLGRRFDAIHASPPCQAFTSARVIHNRKHNDLITPTRENLKKQGLPWIIENVPGSPMRADFILCGSHFGEKRLIRHRLFELSFKPEPQLRVQCNHGSETISVFGHGGHVYHGVENWRDVMGIDWMSRDELSQAIPPVYTEFIGKQLIQQIR